jgi:hypothetical protein
MPDNQAVQEYSFFIFIRLLVNKVIVDRPYKKLFTARFIHLYRRAGYSAITAKHTAIALLWL